MKAYKVVYCDRDGKPWSYSGLGAVEYAVERWTKPKPNNGPLAVFESYDAAVRFLVSMGCVQANDSCIRVYTCEFKPSSKKKIWFYDDTGSKVENLNLPAGTILASAVKLVDFVECWW